MAVYRHVVVEHPLAERLAEYWGIDLNLMEVVDHCDRIRTALQQGDDWLARALWAAALQHYFRCFSHPWKRLTEHLAAQLPPIHEKLENLRSKYYAHAVCELEDNRVTAVVPADPPLGWSPTDLGRAHHKFPGLGQAEVRALAALASRVRELLQPEIDRQVTALFAALRRERTATDWKNAPILQAATFDWMKADRPRPQLGRLKKQPGGGK